MASAHDAPPGDTVKVAPTGGSTQSLDGVSPARQPPLARPFASTRTCAHCSNALPARPCPPPLPAAPPLRAQGYTLKLGTDKIIGNGSFVSRPRAHRRSRNPPPPPADPRPSLPRPSSSSSH